MMVVSRGYPVALPYHALGAGEIEVFVAFKQAKVAEIEGEKKCAPDDEQDRHNMFFHDVTRLPEYPYIVKKGQIRIAS